nr:Fanconi anemia group D2 protein [Hymenolepis microstoma]
MDIKSSADGKCLVFNLSGSQRRTAWHVANTASSRAKSLIAKLSADAQFETDLLTEVKVILTDPNYEFECNALLSSIHTRDSIIEDDVDDFSNEEDQSDVLVLFGSPASLFQIFLSISSLQKYLLDLMLECIGKESTYSASLLAQLLRPVGIKSFFTNFSTIEDTANRLIELIGVVNEHLIKSHILQALPELMASPVEESRQEFSSLAIGGIIQKIIDLLDGVLLSTSEDPENHMLFTEIIECVNHFPLEGSALHRLKSACKDVILHSVGTPSHQKCTVAIIRSLFASELTKSFSSEEICEFITILRNRMQLSKIMLESEQIFTLYVETINMIFRSDNQLKSEWLCYLHRGYSKSGTDNSNIMDDFLILLLAYDSELSIECRSDPTSLSKRKEVLVIMKTFKLVAERLVKLELCESLSKYTAAFKQKELYSPLLTLTNHLITNNQSSSSNRFACLVYSSVFELATIGRAQAECVMRDLCKNIRSFYTAEVSVFTKKRTLNSARACLNILLQLSIKYTNSISAYFDILIGLLDEIAKKAEGSLPDIEDIRKLFLVLVNIAFGRSGAVYVQDDLLIRIRRLLLDSSNKLKVCGLIGAVTLLEIYCRREKRSTSMPPINSTPLSQAEILECSQSSVLSRQILSQLSQGTAGSENTTSRSSHSHSHLSLKGPGTSLADDSQEINIPMDSADLDSITGPFGAFVPTPSRFLLQLVGLVENAVRRGSLLSTQFKTFWLDELAAMFVRLELDFRKSESSKLEVKKFIEWMGSRVMREFQEEFVVDYTPNYDGNCISQLGLNDADICEIALKVGPTLDRALNIDDKPPLSTITRNRLANRRMSRPLVRLSPSPALIPSQLRLLAVVESFKSNRSLDAISALLGCPFVLPSVPLSDLSPTHILIVTNCCTESVNTFARGILLSPSKSTPNAMPRRHPLTSTLTCRLIQIASLRLCLHALLLQRIKNAAVTAAKMPLPSPIYEDFDIMTFDPAFVRALPGRQACVKRLVLFTPSSGKKGTSSKCGQKRKPRRAKGGRAAKRLCTEKSLFGGTDGGGEDIAVDDEDTNDGIGAGDGVESTTLVEVDATVAAEQTMTVDKMAGASSGGKCTVLVHDPLLTCLTPCFRELGLPSILLGLTSPFQPPEKFQWTGESTLIESSLPEAMNSVYDISGVKHFGKDKSPDTPLDWLTVSYLLNELKLKMDHLCGVDLKSSAGWYSFERFDSMSSQLRQSYLLAIVPCLAKIIIKLTCHFKDKLKDEVDSSLPETFNLGLHSSLRLLADCLSTAIYCLVGLTMGFLPSVSSIRSPDILLSKTSSLQLDFASLSRLRCLANCLDDPDRHARLSNEVKEFPPVCMLEEDVLGLTMRNSQSEKEDEKPDADHILRVIQWLVDFSPSGLPHSPCAFVHSCFVLSLTRYLNNSIPAEKSAIYEHKDLVNYTNALLNVAWEATAVWQGNSHKDCLGTLLAFQLHSPFFGPSMNPLADTLDLLINLSKHHLRYLLKKDGSGESRTIVDEEDEVSDEDGGKTRLVYKGLTTQSIGMYARKVLEAFCSCVRRLAKQTAVSGSARCEDLLVHWSASVEVLICIIEAAKGDSPSRAFLDLLPCLMRAGRVFLENLLRGAMSFLNALFRTHGSSVLKFLRNVQHVTRFLHRTCVHAKARQEARLTPLIPQTRKCLEAFVYSVKLLLSQNHCADAFWLGNLKNRDLDGQEIYDTDIDDVVISARGSTESAAPSQIALNEDGFSIDGPPASTLEMESELVEETSDEELKEEEEEEEDEEEEAEDDIDE